MCNLKTNEQTKQKQTHRKQRPKAEGSGLGAKSEGMKEVQIVSYKIVTMI